MNFKGWEKLQEDAKSVVLKHPHGHTMTIAVKALPKILQEQIKHLKFAEGGEVDEEGVSEQGKDVRMAKKLKKRGDPDHKMHEDFAKEEAKGRAKAEREMVKPKLKGLAHGGAVHYYEDGSDQEPVSAQDDKTADSAQAPSAAPPINITVNGAPAQPQAQPTVKSPMPVVGQSAPVAPVQPDIPAVPQANGSSLSNEARKTLQGVDMGKQGLALQEQIDASKAQAAVPVTAEAVQGEQALAAQNARAYNEIMQHTQDFNDYINKNPIDPRHYQANMSSGQKTAAGIGLFLGGLGSAFGGHNYAFDALQKQIDRDLDAQKQNAHNQKTVLGAWQDLYGKNNISTALAKASMNDIMAKKLQLAAAQLGTAQAHANMLQGVNALNAQSAQLRNDAAALAGPAKAAGQLPAGTQGQKPEARNDRILAPDAQKKFQWAMSKFNTIQSPEEKANIRDEYLNAVQVDKALDQIDKLYPELEGKTTYGGYLANKINPAHVGAGAAALTEGLGAMGAIPTGGASLVGAIPAAIAAGGAGTALGAITKQGLRAVGGQTQTQYETAANSLKTIIGSALGGAKLTPTEINEIAEEFLPTAMDSAETKKNKLEKLKQKIVSVTKTGGLQAAGMANK